MVSFSGVVAEIIITSPSISEKGLDASVDVWLYGLMNNTNATQSTTRVFNEDFGYWEEVPSSSLPQKAITTAHCQSCGSTDEEDIGFYMKRARAAELTFGDAAFHRDRVKENVFLPAWDDPRRLEYTLRLGRLLASWLGASAAVSVSAIEELRLLEYGQRLSHRRRALHWLGRIARRQPGLFPHWQHGFLPSAGTAGAG